MTYNINLKHGSTDRSADDIKYRESRLLNVLLNRSRGTLMSKADQSAVRQISTTAFIW